MMSTLMRQVSEASLRVVWILVYAAAHGFMLVVFPGGSVGGTQGHPLCDLGVCLRVDLVCVSA